MMLGMLDQTFGSAGGVFIPMAGATATAITGGAQGQTVIAGNVRRGDPAGNLIVLVGLNARGAIEHSFGDRGLVVLSGYRGYTCGSLLADADGTLLLTATSDAPTARSSVIRLDPHGGLISAGGPHDVDASVDSAEHRSLSLPILTATADSKIVAAGLAHTGSAPGNGDFAIARFLGNGSLDTAFGRGGVTTTDFAGRHFAVSTLLADSNGDVLAVGTVSDDETAHTAILRYRNDGLLDTTFGNGGLALGNFGGDYDRALTGQLLPSGRVLIAGSSTTRRGDRPAFAAYRPDGALDDAFAVHGRGPQEAPDLTGAFTSAAVDPSGRVVLAGRLARGQAVGVGLTRLTDQGLLDPSTGVGGVLITKLNGPGGASAVAVDPTGRIVVAAETARADGLVALRFALPAATAAASQGVPYLTQAALEDQRQELRQRIDYAREMANTINRGISF